MRKDQIFFYSTMLFLMGVLLASLQLSFLIITTITIIIAITISIFGSSTSKYWLLVVLILIGALYYAWNDYHYWADNPVFNQEIKMKGVIAKDPVRRLNNQTFIVNKVLIITNLYPKYLYGDLLYIKGKIKKPPLNYYGRYLAKEGIKGTLNYPSDIKILKRNQGNFIKSLLFTIKNKIINAYQKLLNNRQAGLLAGITLGEKVNLTKDFLNKLSLSGVRHIIALSGMHLTIIISIISLIFAAIFPKKISFIITILAAFAFVSMTGFKLSAVRAAFIAALAALAKNSERIYSPRNALAFAGLILILINPKILVFDVGFQLSFLAVIGIVYLSPAISNNFLALRRLKKEGRGESSFLWWKESLLMTVSAQLTTAPILITQFANFTLTSFIANILILVTVPFIMVLGFLMGAFYYLFYPVAIVLSWLIAMIINYEILIINLFARIALPFNPDLGWWGIGVYYGVLVVFIIYEKKKH